MNVRKKTLKNVAACLAFAGGMCLLPACHDDEAIIEERRADSGSIENTERPTTDQLSVKYTHTAVVLGGDRTNLNASMVNRMDNMTTTVLWNASAFVFTKGSGAALTADEAANMLAAYSSEANFVFINPETVLTDRFVSALRQGVTTLEERGVSTTDATEFIERIEDLKENGELAHREAIGVRKGSTYTVRKLTEMVDSSSVNSSATMTDEAGNITSAKCQFEDYEPTAYDYGLAADKIVTWMKNDASSGSDGSNGAQETIDQLLKAEKQEFNFVLGPSRALEKTMSYSMIFRVYPTYDFDKDVDYYFVRLNNNFHAAELDCVRGTSLGWKKANKQVRFDDGSLSDSWSWSGHGGNQWYGPYMSMFDLRASVVLDGGNGKEVVRLEDPTPQTDVSGTSSHSSGFRKTLAGSFGLSAAGLSGGVSGTLTFSESHTHTEKDLKVVHVDYGDNFTQWRFTGIVPQCHWSLWTDEYHEEVANFQISDWQNELTWIFIVEHPKKGHDYQMSVKNITEMKELYRSIYDYELAVHPENTTIVKMPQPNRARKFCTMICNDNNNGLQTYLEKALPETWKSGVFAYYGKTDDEVKNSAGQWFRTTIKKAVLGVDFGNIGKDGEYTFQLCEQGSATALASFKIKLEGDKAYDAD